MREKTPRPAAASEGADRAGTSKGLGGTFDPQFSFKTNGPQDSVVPTALTRSRSSLQKDQLKGSGIPFIRIGRLVRYRASDVEAWLAKLLARRSTSESAG
jgi:hypothetical protein